MQGEDVAVTDADTPLQTPEVEPSEQLIFGDTCRPETLFFCQKPPQEPATEVIPTTEVGNSPCPPPLAAPDMTELSLL